MISTGKHGFCCRNCRENKNEHGKRCLKIHISENDWEKQVQIKKDELKMHRDFKKEICETSKKIQMELKNLKIHGQEQESFNNISQVFAKITEKFE